MKREYIKQYDHGIYKHYGLFFWQRCSCCKKDFRREKGFRFLTGLFFNGAGRWRYLCQKCAPSKSVANEYAVLGKYIPPRPSAPPPPPPPDDEDAIGDKGF